MHGADGLGMLNGHGVGEIGGNCCVCTYTMQVRVHNAGTKNKAVQLRLLDHPDD